MSDKLIIPEEMEEYSSLWSAHILSDLVTLMDSKTGISLL